MGNALRLPDQHLVVKFKQMVPNGSESFREIAPSAEGYQMLDPYH
jgi:hypothetical protein